MGIVYCFDEQSVRITFDKQYAVKLLRNELTKEQRKANLDKMLDCGRKRLTVNQFNEFYKTTYPALYKNRYEEVDNPQHEQSQERITDSNQFDKSEDIEVVMNRIRETAARIEALCDD